MKILETWGTKTLKKRRASGGDGGLLYRHRGSEAHGHPRDVSKMSKRPGWELSGQGRALSLRMGEAAL